MRWFRGAQTEGGEGKGVQGPQQVSASRRCSYKPHNSCDPHILMGQNVTSFFALLWLHLKCIIAGWPLQHAISQQSRVVCLPGSIRTGGAAQGTSSRLSFAIVAASLSSSSWSSTINQEFEQGWPYDLVADVDERARFAHPAMFCNV